VTLEPTGELICANAEDVAAANYIYQKLMNAKGGTWVEFGALKSE